MSRSIKLTCPLGDHPLSDDAVLVNNAKLQALILKLDKEFTPSQKVCKSCYTAVEKFYKSKLAKVAQQQKLKLNSVSSAQDSIDNLVNQKGLSQHQQSNHSQEQHSSHSASQINVDIVSSESITPLITDIYIRPYQSQDQVEFSLNSTSSESATAPRASSERAAAPRASSERAAASSQSQMQSRKRSSNANVVSVSNEDGTAPTEARRFPTPDLSEDDYMPSRNVMIGARLPNVQPVPKRQKTRMADRRSMDTYLQGLTGG